MKTTKRMHYTTALIMLPLVEEPKSETIKKPAEVFEYCKDLNGLAQETFQILTLNSHNKMINRHMISLGALGCTTVCPREVFRAAILDSASAIICVHNHPSGSTVPSSGDVETTKQLVKAGELIGVKVLDHVIIGGGDFRSLKETGLM